MSILCLTGQDTFILNDRVLNDFSTGTVVEIVWENDIATMQTGKDGNAIFASNAPGSQATATIRIIRGSSDDKFLNGLYSQQIAAFVNTVPLTGACVKKLGDGTGSTTSDSYSLSGGIFIRGVDVQSNVEGDTEQGTSVWRIKFAKAVRAFA